jgi:hypothetical protein
MAAHTDDELTDDELTEGEPVEGRVVHFTFTDPIFGTTLEAFGIVMGSSDDGEHLTVAPVAGYAITVPAADVRLVDPPADDPPAEDRS